MTTPGLRRALTAFRLGDPKGRHAVYSEEGARRTAGRWNRRGDAVIYCCEHYSTAMLEKLVYLGCMPPGMHFVEITIPAGTSYEVFSEAHVPNWHAKSCRDARTFGHEWFDEGRSAILFVPSVVARMEHNIIVNAGHIDAAKITVSRQTPVWWDERLFA